jgi:hypothetical protein|tara:strand:- start:182 stop:379 length:198 start_codon:yes stop_codon:yes gene_type:complete
MISEKEKEMERLLDILPTEMVNVVNDYLLEIKEKLRDATDLLNDCGYQLIDGVWRDMEYYPNDLE